MWVMWLHKFDSYRIINVEMQMKRGHPSAFVGASLLFLYMPELVGCSSRADSSDWADRAVQKEWEDALLWTKTWFVSLSDSVATVDKNNIKTFFFLFVLKRHLWRRSTPINSLQRGWMVTHFSAAEGSVLTIFILMRKHSTWLWEEIIWSCPTSLPAQSERVCLSIWISYWNEYELSVQPLLWAPAMLWALKSD